MMTPPRNRNACEWADESRVLPPGSAEPGKWRSSRTPYCIPIAEACQNPKYTQVIPVMGTQMGKTGLLLNVAGRKLDDDPAPVLYIGPTKSNVENVIEPQVQQMLRQSASLWTKTLKGRKAKTLLKRVSGVTFRLAWAGSATEVASQPAHTVLIDERDKMPPIPGEGDVVVLAHARKATYPDGLMVVTSSPTEGAIDVESHPDTGIEHWKLVAGDDLGSPIWQLFQEGTRYEWAVPCPHCYAYFIPRFRLLVWPEGCTPKRALREAMLVCPRCGALIDDRSKTLMNERGHYLAPGQDVVDGVVVGEEPDTDIASFWVSGLMSPWVSFGERAAAWIRAVASGDQERIRSVLNTGFGELYATRGQAPDWQAVKEACGAEYAVGDMPFGAQWLFLTVDVQKDRLVCVVRAWGAEFESWRIHIEELWGPTDQPEVWTRLDELFARQFNGTGIKAAAVDAGYNTDHVYEWCRRHKATTYATVGRDGPKKLYSASDVEVKRNGKRHLAGLKLWTFDHAYFKAWVHDRLAWPKDQPGAWHLPREPGEDYCRQLVAEQRMRLPSGRVQWVRTSRDNHYLDCEALQALLAQIEGVRGLRRLDAPPPPPKPTVHRRGNRNSGVSIF